jgi:hypothetical protein
MAHLSAPFCKIGPCPLSEGRKPSLDGVPATGLVDHGTWGLAMEKELSPKQILAVRCPTCGAAPGEKCELSTGQPRNNSHLDRRLIAKD